MWSLPPSVPYESRPEFNVNSEWIQRPYDDEAACGAMRLEKPRGSFGNAKYDPASYTAGARENRCRQRPSVPSEKKIIIRRARTGARSPVSSASRGANARQRKPGFRQSRPDERSVAKVAGRPRFFSNYCGWAQTWRFTPEPEKSNGPFTSRLYFVSTSAHTTSGDSRRSE